MEISKSLNLKDGAKRTPVQKTIFLAAYLILTLVLFEAVLRVAYSIEPFLLRTMGDEPLSWQRLWVWGQKRTGLDLVFPIEVYDPLLGWRTAPGLVDVSLGENYLVNTNSSGFRGRLEISEHKNLPRILLLGDSYTFGDQANDDEVFGSLLQQMLPGTEVINMGVRGYGHDQMLLLFQEAGIQLEPDIVILGFLTMDMERNLLDFRNFAKPKYELVGDQLILTNSPVPSPEEVLETDWQRPRLYDLWAFFDHAFAGYSGEKKVEADEITAFILAGLTQAILDSGAVPVFVYFPSDHDIRAYPTRPDGDVYLQAFCRTNPATICTSAWDEFSSGIATGVQYRQLGHWDAAGHRTMAEALYNFILEKKLIP